jgi:hypothetical protein
MILVIAGEGWVAGPDGARTEVCVGQGAVWDDGHQVHTSDTERGLTALVVEGAPLRLFEPEV